jgi:hypothetical protein
MRKPHNDPNSLAPSDLEKKFGDEADTYAQVRSEAAAEAGDDEASERWKRLAAKLLEDRTNGAQT